jgi:mannitol/fructose-specific phosphotransferase system IIA component (Ntr-type)
VIRTPGPETAEASPDGAGPHVAAAGPSPGGPPVRGLARVARSRPVAPDPTARWRVDGGMEGRMKLSDFVVPEAILVDLQATGKEEAIREIVRSLSQAGRLAESDLESVARAILGREELGSTGIGQGVAVPHTRHPTVNRLIGTVALSRRGVDFAALDGDPVDILFLLISPPNQPGDHLRALENISRHLKDERFVSFLRQAKTREQVIDLLEEADQGTP